MSKKIQTNYTVICSNDLKELENKVNNLIHSKNEYWEAKGRIVIDGYTHSRGVRIVTYYQTMVSYFYAK